MSVPFDPTILTRKVNSDVSAQPWFLVKAVADDDIDIATTGNLCIGALTNDVGAGTATIPVYVPVQVGGIIKVVVGTTGCAVGTFAMSDVDGEAVEVTGSKIFAFGIALGTYVDGEVGAFLWCPSFMETT
jgi:hypothetical protein